jgi:hypothetical protein
LTYTASIIHKRNETWKILKKLKIELLYDSAIPLLGIYSKECKSKYKRDTCTTMSIAALFIIAMLWNQPRCPLTDEWKRKCDMYAQWILCSQK